MMNENHAYPDTRVAAQEAPGVVTGASGDVPTSTLPAVTMTGHVIGARYLSHYWREHYTVLSVSPTYAPNGVRVQWADGHYGDHLTFVGNDTLCVSEGCSETVPAMHRKL